MALTFTAEEEFNMQSPVLFSVCGAVTTGVSDFYIRGVEPHFWRCGQPGHCERYSARGPANFIDSVIDFFMATTFFAPIMTASSLRKSSLYMWGAVLN